jgi:CheY-like chemotaxis protein
MSDSSSLPFPGEGHDNAIPPDFAPDAKIHTNSNAGSGASAGEGAEEQTRESLDVSQDCPISLAEAAAEAARALGTQEPSVENSATPPAEDRPERRRRRRAMISAPVRVRTEDVTGGGPDEISTTIDVSRIGFLFLTANPSYTRDMEVLVTFPFSKSPNAIQAEQPGRVVRIKDLEDGRRAVAIAIGAVKQDLIDSGGRVLVSEASAATQTEPSQTSSSNNALASEPLRELSAPEKEVKKHLVLVVDASVPIRDSLKFYLTNEGYEVIAVETANDAREVLNMFTPSIVIAEIEGEGLPGYDLCAHVKTTPRLRHIPVVLTTSSAYPSDYSSAHSLGAVVCMAKPFKQERLGHVVRLLAPPPQAANQAAPPRAADPSRRAGAHRSSKSRPGAGRSRGFRILPGQ